MTENHHTYTISVDGYEIDKIHTPKFMTAHDMIWTCREWANDMLISDSGVTICHDTVVEKSDNWQHISEPVNRIMENFNPIDFNQIANKIK